MKNFFQRSVTMLLVLLLALQAQLATASNLVAGVDAVVSVGEWSNFSAINVINGTALMPKASATTVFSIAFTAGTEADISNMVVYQTASRQSTILSVTPVTFGGISNPSIELTNKKVCKTQPVSTTNPCVVKLDKTALKMEPGNDYYFVIYFTEDSNNGSLGGAAPQFLATTTLTGVYISGDESHLKVGDSLPSVSYAEPYFLVAVTTS